MGSADVVIVNPEERDRRQARVEQRADEAFMERSELERLWSQRRIVDHLQYWASLDYAVTIDLPQLVIAGRIRHVGDHAVSVGATDGSVTVIAVPHIMGLAANADRWGEGPSANLGVVGASLDWRSGPPHSIAAYLRQRLVEAEDDLGPRAVGRAESGRDAVQIERVMGLPVTGTVQAVSADAVMLSAVSPSGRRPRSFGASPVMARGVARDAVDRVVPLAAIAAVTTRGG